MLLILEGVDKSGKSTLADLLNEQLSKSIPVVIIRKQYDERLYPINYTIAQMYDWQAILDRVVLANPNILFIADRSFITQTAFQLAFGTGEHQITSEQLAMFNNYCKVCSDACVVYCKSERFELDHMVQSIEDRQMLINNYIRLVGKFDNALVLNMDNAPLAKLVSDVVTFLQDRWQTKLMTNT